MLMTGEYTNPYYHWWKVHKYWKIPKIHLAHIGKVTWWHGLPIKLDYYSKYFDVKLSGLGWKDKYGFPDFEWDPYLAFTFFRKWQIIFIWNFCPYFLNKKDPIHYKWSSDLTWETILKMSHFGTTISDACHNTGFYEPYDSCSDLDYYIPSRPITMFRNLTRKGWEEYYKTPRSKQLIESKKL